MAVAGAIPTVARNFVGFADAAGREHDSFGSVDFEPAALAIVTERTDHALAIAQQGKDADLHVNLDAFMDAVVLQGANHLEPGPIADMRESRIFVTAEVPLQDASVV